MPIVQSRYKTPFIFRNYHIATIYASTIRRASVDQERERLELPDSDFIDLDWSFARSCPSNRVLIILHGLEGSAKRPYVKGLANLFTHHGWDVAAVNFRGCSGELNRKFSSYHAGASDDLGKVVEFICSKNKYDTICFNGYSLGGNMLLKYLGEGRELPKQIKAAVAVSTPCDLHGSLKKLEESRNRLYSVRFVRKLKKHLYEREAAFPEQINKQEIGACKDLLSIDDLYTSKAHGFKDAADYYKQNSSLQFLQNINIPTLILNARNDGFLSPECYPVEVAEEKENLYLEMPEHGGHVAFLQNGHTTYAEERALEFLERHSGVATEP